MYLDTLRSDMVHLGPDSRIQRRRAVINTIKYENSGCRYATGTTANCASGEPELQQEMLARLRDCAQADDKTARSTHSPEIVL